MISHTGVCSHTLKITLEDLPSAIKQEKKNKHKKVPTSYEELKLFLFTDDMIVYLL